MRLGRAQGIIIRDNKALFGYLIEECKEREIYPEWFAAISELAGGDQ